MEKRIEIEEFMKIRIDTYYDITCDKCGRSWSTDFSYNDRAMTAAGMGMWQNKALLLKAAYKSGWKYRKGATLCPDCLKRTA